VLPADGDKYWLSLLLYHFFCFCSQELIRTCLMDTVPFLPLFILHSYIARKLSGNYNCEAQQ